MKYQHKNVLSLLFIVALQSNISSQTLEVNRKNALIDHPFGISLKLGGTFGVLGGIEIDYFINPYVNLELDVYHIVFLSNMVYNGGGFNVYPWKSISRKWSPFIGILGGYASGTSFLNGYEQEFVAINIPFGVHYIGKKGMNLAMDLALSNIDLTVDRSGIISKSNNFYLYPGLKIGCRF